MQKIPPHDMQVMFYLGNNGDSYRRNRSILRGQSESILVKKTQCVFYPSYSLLNSVNRLVFGVINFYILQAHEHSHNQTAYHSKTCQTKWVLTVLTSHLNLFNSNFTTKRQQSIDLFTKPQKKKLSFSTSL